MPYRAEEVCPWHYSSAEQLSFHPVAGHTIRADFEGGALFSDFGVLLLRGIDRQIGLTARLAAAGSVLKVEMVTLDKQFKGIAIDE
jgi:hypothetical protein